MSTVNVHVKNFFYYQILGITEVPFSIALIIRIVSFCEKDKSKYYKNIYKKKCSGTENPGPGLTFFLEWLLTKCSFWVTKTILRGTYS